MSTDTRTVACLVESLAAKIRKDGIDDEATNALAELQRRVLRPEVAPPRTVELPPAASTPQRPASRPSPEALMERTERTHRSPSLDSSPATDKPLPVLIKTLRDEVEGKRRNEVIARLLGELEAKAGPCRR